eukprot:g3462.t1
MLRKRQHVRKAQAAVSRIRGWDASKVYIQRQLRPDTRKDDQTLIIILCTHVLRCLQGNISIKNKNYILKWLQDSTTNEIHCATHEFLFEIFKGPPLTLTSKFSILVQMDESVYRMAEYGLEDTDLKKTQLNIAKDRAVFNATPDPKQVAEYLRGTKSSGLKAVLRNEFEKIGRARITLGQIAEELREYRAKNIVGKAEPAGGWGDLKDADTNKKIICTGRGEYNLEVRRCVAAAKIKKSGKACKNYLVAIVTKMNIENKEKQQEMIIEKAKKREKELAMIKPEGAMMKGKVKIFADALKLSGDSGSWSSETLATKIDAETGRQLCQEAFAAKREEREAKSMMISVKESEGILQRFGPAARCHKKEKKSQGSLSRDCGSNQRGREKCEGQRQKTNEGIDTPRYSQSPEAPGGVDWAVLQTSILGQAIVLDLEKNAARRLSFAKALAPTNSPLAELSIPPTTSSKGAV